MSCRQDRTSRAIRGSLNWSLGVSDQRIETWSLGFTRAQAEGIADTVSDIALTQIVSKVDLREALSELKVELLKFMFGAMAAQTALILIELLNDNQSRRVAR